MILNENLQKKKIEILSQKDIKIDEIFQNK